MLKQLLKTEEQLVWEDIVPPDLTPEEKEGLRGFDGSIQWRAIKKIVARYSTDSLFSLQEHFNDSDGDLVRRIKIHQGKVKTKSFLDKVINYYSKKKE